VWQNMASVSPNLLICFQPKGSRTSIWQQVVSTLHNIRNAWCASVGTHYVRARTDVVAPPLLRPELFRSRLVSVAGALLAAPEPFIFKPPQAGFAAPSPASALGGASCCEPGGSMPACILGFHQQDTWHVPGHSSEIQTQTELFRTNSSLYKRF
jgi:hypothetical protein